MYSSSSSIQAKKVDHNFVVEGYSATKASSTSFPSNRLTMGGYNWEIHYTPSCYEEGEYWVAFKLVFLGPAIDLKPGGTTVKVNASLRCHLVVPTMSPNWDIDCEVAWLDREDKEWEEKSVAHEFLKETDSSPWVRLSSRKVVDSYEPIIGCDSFRAKCTITVLMG
uniref:MATH domain-containing protein n=1 Tax=Leersia perrieri TaxID=77586 RepID=A0A0D9WT24_9ORYZ